MLKDYNWLAVHELLQLRCLKYEVGLRLIQWALEAAETFKDRKQLLSRVPYLYVWIVVLLNFLGRRRSPAYNLSVDLYQQIVRSHCW